MKIFDERKNGFMLQDVGQRYRSAGASGTSHLVSRTASGMSRPHKSIKRVPFSGVITNKLLAALPDEIFARLLPHLEPIFLSLGENLFGFNEDVQDVYFPESAVVSHLYILEDGGTTEADMVGKEGMIGLSAILDAPAPTHLTQAIISGTALRICATVLKEEFARSQTIQRLFLAHVGTRIEQLSQRAVCNCRHTVGERLCSWLLMIHDRLEKDQLPLTHELIARHLGARRAGITAVLAMLRDRHALNNNRGQISILDRQKLEMSACECYRKLSQQPQHLTALSY